MQAEIEKYLDMIRADYTTWGRTPGQPQSETRLQMDKEFSAALTTSEGGKYIKVITGPQRSVHSFIVKADDGKFKRGDILKAAGWAAPAKNFARGNVLTGDFGSISWTGA